MNAFLDPPLRPAACLSDFVLDQLVAGDLSGELETKAREHLERCARCSERLEAFAAVEPPALASPTTRLSQSSKRSRWLRPEVGAAAAAALALLIAVVALRPGPGDGLATEGGTREKGGFTLGLMVRRSSGDVVRLAPGDVVRPGEGVRFEVATVRAGFVAVIGIDSAGAVTVYAPQSGSMAKIEAGPAVVLDEAIVADDTLGAERVTAVLCPEPLSIEKLRALGERAISDVSGDPRLVKTLGVACAETSVLFDKRREP